MSDVPTIAVAGGDDLVTVHALVERAYRGDTARGGWTHEADLLDTPRTTLAEIAAIVADPARRLLIAREGGIIVGSVTIADLGDGRAYLGQLCVDPARQGGGLGRILLSGAEEAARTLFAARRIEMTVIDLRGELIAWYRRRGYEPTGERRPFPIALDPPLSMTVLARPLQASVAA